jgi:hypothetical protein
MFALVIILAMVGLVPCLLGTIILSVLFKARHRAALIRRVPTSPAVAVASMRPGQLVEVTGTLRCPKPLKSELAGEPCAYAVAWIDRVFDQEERDENGDSRTVESTETLATSVRSTSFFVEDASGRVRVVPDGAEVDARSVHNRFEPGPSRGRTWLGGKTVDLNHGFGTHGYQFREEVLPIDGPVYVLGVVTRDGSIGQPAKGARDAGFIISHRSEAQVASSYKDDRVLKWCGYGMMALGGLFFVIAGTVGVIWL